jgi:integrase/recombinase XerD
LFEGLRNQYSASSIANIVKNAADKAGIKKHVTPHMLRHSYATHLLEQGVDIRYIQELLGHENMKTTEIYTHVSQKGINNIVNPLDKMNI